MFDKFSTGNFYLREWGTGNREQGTGNREWGTHKKQSNPVPYPDKGRVRVG
jgi:hypothetical protein